jgi:arsenite methyltransferase
MSSVTADELREEVRRRYADSARAVTEGEKGSCGGGSCCTDEVGGSGEAFYDAGELGELPTAATLASLGCGNPTAVAELREGETVLDLGSGGGIDVILSAKRVGATGLAYGLDMTEEMLALARTNAAEAGVRNAIFLRGLIEDVPLPASSVDVVISNCVINLSVDKPAVFAELARVVKPAAGSGSQTSSPRTGSPRRSAPSGAATSAASPAPSRKASTRPRSPAPASSRCRSSSRTRSLTACTARSSRRSSPRTPDSSWS